MMCSYLDNLSALCYEVNLYTYYYFVIDPQLVTYA